MVGFCGGMRPEKLESHNMIPSDLFPSILVICHSGCLRNWRVGRICPKPSIGILAWGPVIHRSTASGLAASVDMSQPSLKILAHRPPLLRLLIDSFMPLAPVLPFAAAGS